MVSCTDIVAEMSVHDLKYTNAVTEIQTTPALGAGIGFISWIDTNYKVPLWERLPTNTLG